jgi:methionyl-tRNA synthetase
MSNNQKKFYLTTPIYYVNARPHIGHAYTTIAADVIARRHRLLGDDTFFLTGTDEHGQKIERSAAAAGILPQQFADEVSASFQKLWERMGITNNKFIRTTDEAHKKGAQKLFALLQKNGFIELRTYTGQYSVGEEMFVEGPPGTIGPDGKPTETVSEENYFFKLSTFQRPLIDLIESEDPENRLIIQPESRKNEVLSFLRGNISSQSDAQSSGAPSLPESHPGKGGNDNASPATPTIAHSTAGIPYVPGALKDLSVSRSSFKWGIPVPGDEKHVIYVWLDALTNYMTAIGYGSEDPAEQEKFNHYWPADLHLVGKEIIRFHCVYWPAFLMAMKPEDQTQEEWNRKMLPKQITAHGWLLFEDSKMSKSRGNIVRTETILDAFGTLLPKPAEADSLVKGTPSTVPQQTAENATLPAEIASPIKGTASTMPQQAVEGAAEVDSPVKGTASAVPQQTSESAALAAEVRLSSPSSEEWKKEQDLFAADVLRYFLLREIPFGQDGSFSFDALVQRYNSDLANGYGNLVSRTLNMVHQYFGGSVPTHVEWGHKRIGFRRENDSTGVDWSDVVDAPLADDAHALQVFYDSAFAELRFAAQTDEWQRSAGELIINKDRYPGVLDLVQSFIAKTDGLITRIAPWKLAKSDTPEDQQDLQEVLYLASEAIRITTALLYPILPYTTAKVWRQLGLGDIQLASDNGELTTLIWGGLKPGTKLGPLAPIFPRADKGLIQLMIDMEQNNAPHKPAQPAGLPHVNADLDASAPTHTEFRETPISSASATQALNPIAESTHPISAHHIEPPATPDTPQIAIDDFIKIDLRVAKIVVAERIPKADKLLRLEVDLGYETRQILSGIAQWYTPEELIGRKIVVIANLAPRKMRGLESHGMLLAASHGEDGKPVLATFGEDIALGSRLK